MKLHELLRDINKITDKLGISEAFLCGGTPRDRVMNNVGDIADIDITTGDPSVKYLAKELAILLGKHYSFDQNTMPDGHISIQLGNMKIDFSSNFVAPNIDQHLNKLNVPLTDINREMYSRDFTCNSLLMKTDLKTILDPTQYGIKDIHDKIIRTNLDPSITLTTNKNRVVRAIYLASKLDFNLDPNLAHWIKDNPQSIKLLSSDHSLKEKLNKAVEYNPHKTASLLTELGLWEYIPITPQLQPLYAKRTLNAVP